MVRTAVPAGVADGLLEDQKEMPSRLRRHGHTVEGVGLEREGGAESLGHLAGETPESGDERGHRVVAWVQRPGHVRGGVHQIAGGAADLFERFGRGRVPVAPAGDIGEDRDPGQRQPHLVVEIGGDAASNLVQFLESMDPQPLDDPTRGGDGGDDGGEEPPPSPQRGGDVRDRRRAAGPTEPS